MADRLLAERERELAALPPTESRFWTAPLGGETAVSLTHQVFADAKDTVWSAMGTP